MTGRKYKAPVSVRAVTYQAGNPYDNHGVWTQHDVIVEIAGHRFITSALTREAAEKIVADLTTTP